MQFSTAFRAWATAATLLVALSPAARVQAQVVSGQVRQTDDTPLGYVNVGLVRDKRGTVSDSLGHYRLDLSGVPDDDSLRVSMLGFRPLVRAVADIRRGNTHFQLAEAPIQMASVTIWSRTPRQRRIGNRGRPGAKIRFGGNSLGTELCTEIKLQQPSEVQYVHLFLDDNRQPVKVRIHFYPVVDGKPGPLPLTPPVYATLPTGAQEYTLDVRNQGLQLEGNVFMGVEILAAQDLAALTQVGFYGGLYNGPTYSRETHLSAWERVYDWVFVFGVGFALTVLQ